jgi:DNA-binding response OmpR family regulator
MPLILILDRNARVRAALAAAFLAQGYPVLRDARGAAGLILTRMHMPQVVLVARDLVDMDGLTFAQRLRAIPLVVQPALVLLGIDRAAVLGSAVDPCGVFPKPLDLAAVLTQVALVAPCDGALMPRERLLEA